MDARKAALIRLYALFFVFSAVTLVFSGKSYNFIQVKEIFFSAGAAVLAALFFFRKNIIFKKQALLVFALPLWFAVSAAAGSFTYAAAPVFAAACGLAVLYILAAGSEWDLKSLRAAVVASSFPAVAVGLVQVLIPDTMKEFMVFGSRVPSFLGNPNFFGAYIAGILPLALAGAMDEKGYKRILYSLYLAVAAVCLAATGSKAAAIGFVFAVSWPVFLFIKGNRDIKKNLVITACLLSLLVVGYVAAMGLRLSKTTDRKEWVKNESVFFRAYTWLGTLGMIKIRPITGTGPGAFSLAYPEYRKPEIMLWTHEHSYETTQPENIILQLAAETGLPGLIIAACLLVLVIIRAGPEHNEYLAGLFAILIVNLAGVDLNYITSSMLVMLYSGVIMSAGPGSSISLDKWKKTAFAAGLIAAACCALVYQVNRHLSLVYLKKGVYFSRTGQWGEALENYDKSLKHERNNPPALYFMANSYLDSGAAPEKGMEKYALLEKLAPNYVLMHYNKARLYAGQGDYVNAEKEYNKMLRTDPYFRPALTDMAQLMTEKLRDYDGAEMLIKKALEKYPEDAALYNNLGNIYFMSGKVEASIEAFKKAVDLKQDKDYYYNLGCVYFTDNDLKNADFYLKKAQEMDPDDPKILDMLRKTGQYRRAK